MEIKGYRDMLTNTAIKEFKYLIMKQYLSIDPLILNELESIQLFIFSSELDNHYVERSKFKL